MFIHDPIKILKHALWKRRIFLILNFDMDEQPSFLSILFVHFYQLVNVPCGGFFLGLREHLSQLLIEKQKAAFQVQILLHRRKNKPEKVIENLIQ